MGSTLKLNWLKENMLTLLVEPTPPKLVVHCKTYIFGLIGGGVDAKQVREQSSPNVSTSISRS